MGQNDKGQHPGIPPALLEQIQKLAETIRYGSITLVFQDGVLVQIEKNEKIRIPKP